MAMYAALLTWTDQGIKDYRDTVQRAASFRNLVEKGGGQVRELLWTMGEYDLVAIMEAPNNETATGIMLELSTLGNVRTETLPGFNADQMNDIIGRMS